MKCIYSNGNDVCKAGEQYSVAEGDNTLCNSEDFPACIRYIEFNKYKN